MVRNVGSADRVARISFGLILLAVAVGLFGRSAYNAWGWFGVMPVASGLVEWCPFYSLFGLATRESRFSDDG
jgi:hypothetical protein